MSDTHAAENAASEAAAQANAGGDDVEARARRMGWKPKEEFKGDESRWTDAASFVDRGLSAYPVLLDRYKVLDERSAKTERALAEANAKIGEQTQVLKDLAEFNRKAEDRAYARAERELKERQKVAVAHADTEGFNATQVELDKLAESRQATKPNGATEQRQQPAPQTQQQPQIAPEVAEWVRENTWFDKDPEARAAATGIHGDLLARNPGMPLRENLAKVREVIAKRYPEHFENPARTQAAAVATPGASPSPKRRDAHSYENLPPEAKKACDRFMKQIPGYTREQYVAQFDWS